MVRETGAPPEDATRAIGMRTEVRRDQFERREDVLVHRPTGASFSYDCKVIDWGEAGRQLPSGEKFDPVDIGFIAGELLLR